MLDSKFPGDRQGIGGRASVRIVVNRDFGHADEIAGDGCWVKWCGLAFQSRAGVLCWRE